MPKREAGGSKFTDGIPADHSLRLCERGLPRGRRCGRQNSAKREAGGSTIHFISSPTSFSCGPCSRRLSSNLFFAQTLHGAAASNPLHSDTKPRRSPVTLQYSFFPLTFLFFPVTVYFFPVTVFCFPVTVFCFPVTVFFFQSRFFFPVTVFTMMLLVKIVFRIPRFFS